MGRIILDNELLNPSTLNYTNFLLETASKGTFVEIVTAITPCLHLYVWIGQSLRKENYSPTNPYSEWINTYEDEILENLAKSLELLLDKYSEETIYQNYLRYTKGLWN